MSNIRYSIDSVKIKTTIIDYTNLLPVLVYIVTNVNIIC